MAPGTDIHGRRYSAAAVGGPIFTVNQATAGSQGRPRVDMNSGGEFAVVWQSSGGSTLPGGQVLARLFDGAANAETDDLVIAIDNGGEPVSPDISFDDRDNIAVAYERRDSAARSTGVFRRSVVTLASARRAASRTPRLSVSTTRASRSGRAGATPNGQQGQARASALTADTGSFWFFDRGNVEVVVKALDACAIADSFWIFAAGLTDVEVSLQVEDTKSGESISYFSPFSPFQPIRDTSAFGGCPTASDEPGGAQPWSAEPQPARGNRLQTGRSTAKAAAPCSPTTTTLCLGGRFELSMLFETRAGQSGAGQAVAMTADTGYFWFFSEDNVEAGGQGARRLRSQRPLLGLRRWPDRRQGGFDGARPAHRPIQGLQHPRRQLLSTHPGPLRFRCLPALTARSRPWSRACARSSPPSSAAVTLTERRLQRMVDVARRRLSSVTVVMENLWDRHNAAAVIRSAEALGLDRVHVVEDRHRYKRHPAILHGADRWIGIERHIDLEHCIERLCERGFVTCAADLGDGAVELSEVPVDRPIAIFLGTEKAGLSDRARTMTDLRYTIPMAGFTGSFNVSVSAAVSLWELTQRRRRAIGAPRRDLDQDQICERLRDWLARRQREPAR